MNDIKQHTAVPEAEPATRAPTTEPPMPTTEAARSSRTRVMVILLAAGAFVVGLLGGWMLAGDGDDPTTWGAEIDEATLTEIDELLDDYWAGWDAGDGNAVVAEMATDGRFSSVFTPPDGLSGEALETYVESYDYLGFTQVGPTTVIRTAAGYEVTGTERVDEYHPEPMWALDHFVIVEEDGQLRIASHRVISTV